MVNKKKKRKKIIIDDVQRHKFRLCFFPELLTAL